MIVRRKWSKDQKNEVALGCFPEAIYGFPKDLHKHYCYYGKTVLNLRLEPGIESLLCLKHDENVSGLGE
jgi:hypothetical protein